MAAKAPSNENSLMSFLIAFVMSAWDLLDRYRAKNLEIQVMNRTWAWAMWLLWLICFQFSLLLFYWLQTSVQTVSMAWGAEQTILCLLACGFFIS